MKTKLSLAAIAVAAMFIMPVDAHAFHKHHKGMWTAKHDCWTSMRNHFAAKRTWMMKHFSRRK